MSESAAVNTGELIVPPEVLDAIGAAERLALTGHVTPDADCLGAMGALSIALAELGKHCYASLPAGSVSRRMQYLVDEAALAPATAKELVACDTVLVVDTAKPRRVNIEGKLDALPRARVINIDHHRTNQRFGTVDWIEPHASSTCELVYHLLCALGCQITPTIATMLYAGLHSDTQGFSLSNTTPESLEVGHALALAGARLHDVCERLHRSHAPSEFELLKVVYANTRIGADGLLAWSTVSFEELAATGCGKADIEDQVEIPRSIEGIKAAILLSEGERGKVRCNFRGEGGFPVVKLAQQFGGGGHLVAAGAEITGTLDEVAPRVIEAAEVFIRRGTE